MARAGAIILMELRTTPPWRKQAMIEGRLVVAYATTTGGV
jgi:hypothetical protein